MIKKLIILSCAIICNFAYAETCPSIFELRTHQLHHWQATDFNSAEPASKEKTIHFLRKATHLTAVSWDFSQFGRCFYAGENEDAEQLDVFLEKTASPDESRGNWHYVDPDSTECDGNLNDCAFKHSSTG